MKKIIKILVSLVLVNSLAISEDNQSFESIKSEVVNASQKIYSYRASDALNAIKINQKVFKEIYEKVKKIDNTDKIIDEVADGLDAIANSYEKIAKMSVDILKTHNKEINGFDNIDNSIKVRKESLYNEKQEYIKRLHSLEKTLETEKNSIEKKKIEVSIKATRNNIKILENTEKIWSKFHKAENKLVSKLKMISEKTGLFLHTLKENATVYRNASNIARLRQSAKETLSSLNSLSGLEDTIIGLENSWMEVSDLIGIISNPDFES